MQDEPQNPNYYDTILINSSSKITTSINTTPQGRLNWIYRHFIIFAGSLSQSVRRRMGLMIGLISALVVLISCIAAGTMCVLIFLFYRVCGRHRGRDYVNFQAGSQLTLDPFSAVL
jgi:hypothetical protein